MQSDLFKDNNISFSDKFLSTSNLVLHEGSSFEFLKTIPSNSIMLIITSPPYNIGKEYETKVSIDKYLEEQEIVINEI